MSAAFKLGGDEFFDAVLRGFNADNPRTEAQNIRVIMLARKAGGQPIMAKRGADRAVAVDGDAHADARTANKNALTAVIYHNPLRHRLGIVRVINGLRVVRAKIRHLIANFSQEIGKAFLHLKPTMVTGNGYFLFLHSVL